MARRIEPRTAADLEAELRHIESRVGRFGAVTAALVVAARAAGAPDAVVTGGAAVALVQTLDSGTVDIDGDTPSGDLLGQCA